MTRYRLHFAVPPQSPVFLSLAAAVVWVSRIRRRPTDLEVLPGPASGYMVDLRKLDWTDPSRVVVQLRERIATRPVATSRQVTGAAYHHGYVARRGAKRVEWGCLHKHATAQEAVACARSRLRGEQPATDSRPEAQEPLSDVDSPRRT